MTEPRDIAAVFFDMDGTLIDSELNTEPAITSVCRELGLPDPALDYTAFYGWTWSSVVDAMVDVASTTTMRTHTGVRITGWRSMEEVSS